MGNQKKSVLERSIRSLIERLESRIKDLEFWDIRLSRVRLAIFLVGSFILFFTAQQGYNIWVFGSVFALFVILFAVVASFHSKIVDTKRRFSLLKSIKKEHLARMKLHWGNLPEASGEQLTAPPNHPFAEDFNIVGRHSLVHLLDTSIYPGSINLLKSWLLSKQPEPEKIRERQKLVSELVPLIHFRDRLRIKAAETRSHTSEKDWSMSDLLVWLGKPSGHRYGPALLLLGGLSVVNIVLGILFLVGAINPYVIFTFVIYLIVYNFNSNKIRGLFDAAYQMDKLLSRFSELLLYLEEFPFKENTELSSFVGLYKQADSKPSGYLKKISRLSAAASSQKNEILWFLLNSVVPWDLYFSARLEAYKSELKPKLTAWLDRFYRLEALNSLAHFAWLNPHYRFEQPLDAGQTDIAFKAEHIGHPLIPDDEKVSNDITIDKVGNLILLTGSNMAGKSTFLRTLGINLCLCFAGGPVDARKLETIPFRLFSSINVKDSLDEGLSHFYAEVKRLRKLLDELESDHPYPLFFFVDEIYRGTNNRERFQGSTAFLKQVARKNGVGMVTTHDLELAQLEEEIPQLSNWHFEETIEGGKMSFEYKLKPGPCPTTNALKIMQMEGLPV